jgi:hypothetical protein
VGEFSAGVIFLANAPAEASYKAPDIEDASSYPKMVANSSGATTALNEAESKTPFKEIAALGKRAHSRSACPAEIE